MKTLKTTLALMLAFLMTLPAWAANRHGKTIEAEVESGYVFTGMNDVRIPGDSGTFLSLANELKTDPSPYYRVRLGVWLGERHLITGLYSPLRLNARGTLSKDVNFAGTFFPAGSPVFALYRFDSYRLTYRYSLIQGGELFFGFGITAKLRDAEISLHGAQSGVKLDTGPVPLLNFRLHWRPGDGPNGILLDADAAAAPQGRAEDVLVAFTSDLSDGAELRIGYRMLEGGADNDKVYTFAWLHYLSVGLGLSF
jgi:hypothetical protein